MSNCILNFNMGSNSLLYFKLLLGGKSSVLMDVKPWDDETDMKKLEEAVRSVEMPGLLWGACTFRLSIYNESKL